MVKKSNCWEVIFGCPLGPCIPLSSNRTVCPFTPWERVHTSIGVIRSMNGRMMIIEWMKEEWEVRTSPNIDLSTVWIPVWWGIVLTYVWQMRLRSTGCRIRLRRAVLPHYLFSGQCSAFLFSSFLLSSFQSLVLWNLVASLRQSLYQTAPHSAVPSFPNLSHFGIRRENRKLNGFSIPGATWEAASIWRKIRQTSRQKMAMANRDSSH